MNTPNKKQIIFLDGDCVLCQKSAQLLHRIDAHDHLLFTSLQGKTASQLPEEWLSTVDTNGQAGGAAVFAESFGTEEVTYWRGSDAILHALKAAGGIGIPLSWLLIIPKSLREIVYRWIARNRHRFIRKNDTCSMPDPIFLSKQLP